MDNKAENNKVLLGMSGGTDSSVAALLLQEEGYDVTGVTFRFYEKDGDTSYLADARDLCRKLGIEHIVYDAREIFKEQIMQYFTEEYLAGRTPVPCTLCNNFLKWPLLAKIADEMGIYHLATGHYVNKRLVDGYWHITCGDDHDKDQSFFLWGLKQDILTRMLLPMGHHTKTSIREYAQQRGFLKVATKKDSIGVCFCPMDYRSFLRKEAGEKLPPHGYFYDEMGNVLGKHEGYPFYTIGQRRGLGIYLNKAIFVKDILPAKNQVIIADHLSALEKTEMWLSNWNIINPDKLIGHDDVIIKIRYRKQANRCRVSIDKNGLMHVVLHEPLASVACGQAAAFYWGNVILGGGIIEKSV